MKDPSAESAAVSQERGPRPAWPEGSVGAVVITYGAGPPDFQIVSDLIAAGIANDRVVCVHNPDGSGRTPSLPSGTMRVALDRNAGYSVAANRGIAELLALGVEWVFLVTHDLRIDRPSVERMISVALDAPDYGVIGPELRRTDTDAVFSIGGWISWTGSTCHFDTDGVQPNPRGLADVEWLDGTCLLLNARALRAVGGFDERLFLYFEDAAMCAVLASRGWRVGVCVGATARTSPGGVKRRAAYEYFVTRNGLEFAKLTGGRRRAFFAALRRGRQLLGIAVSRSDPAGPTTARARGAVAAAGLVGAFHWVAGVWGPPPKWIRRRSDIGGL